MVSAQIREMKLLLDEGLLTAREFSQVKARILGIGRAPSGGFASDDLGDAPWQSSPIRPVCTGPSEYATGGAGSGEEEEQEECERRAAEGVPPVDDICS